MMHESVISAMLRLMAKRQPALIATDRLVLITEKEKARLDLNEEQLRLWRSEGNQSIRTLTTADVWVESELDDAWGNWTMASRIVADSRGVPVVAEIRVFP